VSSSSGQPVSLWRGQYLVPAGSQNRNVLHHALPAHPKMPRQLATLRRPVLPSHPRQHSGTALLS
jgi:hypothetical protein